MLLPFTMQMTLILVLSSVVSATPLFRRVVVALAEVPSSAAQAVSLAVGLGTGLSYCHGDQDDPGDEHRRVVAGASRRG